MANRLIWVNRYLRKPYAEGAQGPDAFNCWGLFRAVQQAHFGREVPLVNFDPANEREIIGLFARHDLLDVWRRVDVPVHGDAVIIRSPLHIGVWLDYEGGAVLHCVRGAGVLVTPDELWDLSGFGRREYRHFEGA